MNTGFGLCSSPVLNVAPRQHWPALFGVMQQEDAMITTKTRSISSKSLALWLCTGLIGITALAVPPANAENDGHHRNERHHANPYRDNDGQGYRHSWHHHHRTEHRCTSRPVSYWDSFWRQWRTNYVRECW